jgi:diketogulonate reductase-like aldo/keto reductase
MYQMGPGQVSVNSVLHALKAGYRHFDTAEYYKNELDIGEALKMANIPRSEVFLTSKIFQTKDGRDVCKETLLKCLENIKSSYIDQYLIHAPQGGKVLECYDTLLDLQKEGLIKSIGVSNFGVHHLEALKSSGRPLPAVNQIELHPWCRNDDIVEFCKKNNIAVVGYSPITKGLKLSDEVLNEISKIYIKSPAQILIKWSLQNGFITIPKSSTLSRIDENSNVFDFWINEQDMQTLNSLGANAKFVTGWDPTKNEMSQFGPIF